MYRHGLPSSKLPLGVRQTLDLVPLPAIKSFPMPGLFTPISNILRRRKREALLREAANWPVTTAKLLKSSVEEKDSLALGGNAFQDRQVESAFYFTLENHPSGSYFGGHLRSAPLSDSEAHRACRALPEDTPVQVRYNPQDPDQALALPADNPTFPITLWPA